MSALLFLISKISFALSVLFFTGLVVTWYTFRIPDTVKELKGQGVQKNPGKRKEKNQTLPYTLKDEIMLIHTKEVICIDEKMGKDDRKWIKKRK